MGDQGRREIERKGKGKRGQGQEQKTQVQHIKSHHTGRGRFSLTHNQQTTKSPRSTDTVSSVSSLVSIVSIVCTHLAHLRHTTHRAPSTHRALKPANRGGSSKMQSTSSSSRLVWLPPRSPFPVATSRLASGQDYLLVSAHPPHKQTGPLSSSQQHLKHQNKSTDYLTLSSTSTPTTC